MSDQPHAAFLSALGLSEGVPSTPVIFQVGDRIAETDPASMRPAPPVQRVGVLGALTVDYLARAVACAVLQEGVFPIVHQAPFGTYVQAILDPASSLFRFKPDLVVIAPHWRDMAAALPIGSDAAAVDAALGAKVGLFRTIWLRLAAAGIRIIQHRMVPPAHRYRGSADRSAPAAPACQIARLNAMLTHAGTGMVTWLDMEELAQAIGKRRFAPAKLYYGARLDHDPKWLPDYLPVFRAAWRSANARAKKVLVVDLDNTIWGGVIGDDGVEGISLGPGSSSGEAFADWQHYLKELGNRGVVLAACSKNDPAVAATGFNHPASVLQRDDFAAFACSWGDKAAGLRQIARALNISLDSFVFCDDNPAECALIRGELPEVAVVCLGSDPTGFIDRFDAGVWFDADSYTPEDLSRSKAYVARAAAAEEQATTTDVGAYLAGLAMKGRLQRPANAEVSRVAQLEQKTNQFNLTTRRYSETDIRALLDRPDVVVLAFHLTDRFGDHGLTSTLIAVQEGDALRIDNWLMSCRIFARSAEQFMLRGLIEIARQMGAERLLGEFRPTPRNVVVADLYLSLGFTAAGDGFFVRPVSDAMDDVITAIAT